MGHTSGVGFVLDEAFAMEFVFSTDFVAATLESQLR